MIIIDPGHGGKDPGAVSGDMKEKDYTLLISNYMYDRFKELGVPVFITRNTDETLTPEERIRRIRPNITSSDDIVISSHLNAGGGDGAEVVYALRNNNTLSKMILDGLNAEGQNIRKYYQRKLPSNPNKDYYFIIRDTSPAESILLEYAFIDSLKDDKKQIKEDWMKWAEAVVKAISDYKGYNYVPRGGNTVNDAYIVQKGDTLWSIAKRFNVSVQALKDANSLSNSLISVGQELIIPGVAPSSQTNTTYIVQKGDSLWSIANSNNTTIDEIVNLNDLLNNTIYVGQELKIPNSTMDMVSDDNMTYVVKKGDTLYSIALKYSTTPNKIKELNNLYGDFISIGQVLVIPNDVESTGMGTINPSTYIVREGDTLWSIAINNGVTVNSLRMVNNLNSDFLRVGQVLIIPQV